MEKQCTQLHCYPGETGCNEGHVDHVKCRHFKKDAITISEEIVIPAKEEELSARKVPWTGNTLGLHDLTFLSSRSKITVIGIAGATSAGKTTFLASLYCLIRHGANIGRFEFAGSHTFIGWENIAWYLSWKKNNEIQFPPHTTSNAGRVPGMLHLALRDPNGVIHDVVFTDAPGEWFNSWATSKNDPEAAGARWIYQNADAFLLFADCEMLQTQSKDLGTARLQLRSVSDRLKENLSDRPLGLVWAKSDFPVAEAIKSSLVNYITNSSPKYFNQFDVSVKPGENNIWHVNIIQSVIWLLEVINTKQNTKLTLPVITENDYFLSIR